MDLKRRPLLAGAFALLLAGVANRLIGTLYRALLVRVGGEEVVGLFQMTMPVYRIVSTLAAAGLPVAIARLAADSLGKRDYAGARSCFRVGLSLTAATAAASSAFLFLTHRLWAHTVMTDSRTEIALAVLPLLLFPAAFSASLRGVLQGQERLSPVAVSSFVEAASRVPAVLLLVTLLLPLGAGWAAGGIALGFVAGEAISVYYLARSVRGSWQSPENARRPRRGRRSTNSRAPLSRPSPPPGPGKPRPEPRGGPRTARPLAFRLSQAFVPFWAPAYRPTVGRLAAVAAPVLLSGLVNGVLGMFNVAVIPRELIAAGYAPAEATVLYGRLFGMALPALYMPMVAVHPLVHASIPAVAKRLAERRTRAVARLLFQCFAVAVTVAAFSAFAFWRYAQEVGALLYGVQDLGPLIRPLAFAAPFVYTGHIAAGILYGLGRTGIAMVNTVAGSGLRLILIFLLAGDPRWGIVGALWAVIADYALTAVLDTGALLVLVPRALRRRGK